MDFKDNFSLVISIILHTHTHTHISTVFNTVMRPQCSFMSGFTTVDTVYRSVLPGGSPVLNF